ncbi:hypothetical protein TVAG_115760 [Trichomonas vaginalis G3]|uniref:Uncharacterized protein n=1 Tax=Trichomonas vaginalis (strain ATCC PRA-98 / G3) TaxID=412133 RepID=A2EH49_TRIV3|nr:immunoglobulin-like fold protein family [Trichomonas vaginalis G3]EAY08017.1 hypothetical protein TVAG_115760 [Trichomonas vaginalis G3]KAI5537359.1 immunoglobulin-like fold protein family [Trichomonas vaginalis G3]|eukprot:XP_001320240.1 hypothetical protein [Trichomonas vaginalis G3]
MDGILTFFPTEVDFGVKPTSERPFHKEILFTNSYTKTVSVIFQGTNDEIFFIKSNQQLERQRSTHFDIFSQVPHITNFIIPPKTSKALAIVMHMGSKGKNAQEISGNIKMNCYLIDTATTSDDEYAEFDPDEEDAPWRTFELPYKAKIIEPTIEIIPHTIFLDECCKDQPTTTRFSIKNTSPLDLTILTYPQNWIRLISSKNTKCFNLSSDEVAQFEVTYLPQNTGQFDHRIEFALGGVISKPYNFRILSSVSPAKIPADFPQFTPRLVDYGDMRTNDSKEVVIQITNPSQLDYTCQIGSFSESFKREPLLFKTALRSQLERQTTVVLNSQSTRTIYVHYTPTYNENASPGTFEKRAFVVTLTYKLSNNGSVFYRRIPVTANICHSFIHVPNTVVNFGDIPVLREPRHSSIRVQNISPMPTSISVISTSRWIALSQSKFELQPLQTIDYNFSFYPYKVSPDFGCAIKFTNDSNSLNEVSVTISAAVLCDNDEVTHSNYYSLISDGKAIHSLDFNFVSANFPAIKSLTIKNTSKEVIKMSIKSSTPQLQLYEEIFDPNDLIHSTSTSSISSMQIEQPPEMSIQGVNSIKQLSMTMNQNSSFFNNMYLYGTEKSDADICLFYERQLEAFSDLKEKSLKGILESEIEITPGNRINLWAVLIPEPSEQCMHWTHQRCYFEFDLLSVKSRPPPHTVYVRYNISTSQTFLTSHHLNYGNLVRKTIKENQIYLLNESAIPLLYKLETQPDSYVSILKGQRGIVPPLDSRSIPIRFETPVEGNVNDIVIVRNILNPLDVQEIHFKACVERRAGFFVDPLEIDFGEVTFGSSATVSIYIKNIREEESEYTFSHYHRDNQIMKPMISFQYKNLSESHLSAAVELQIEKQHRKLLCLKRKKKMQYAEKIQKIIDNLKKKSLPTENSMKRSTAKSIDRYQLQSASLQTHCIDIQFIPVLKTKKQIQDNYVIEGTITVSEDNRQNTSKDIRYKAIVKPQRQTHSLLDESGDRTICLTPNHLDYGTVTVQTVYSKNIEIKNLSTNNSTRFWISSDTSDDAILSFGVNEGQLNPNESINVPVELICLTTGNKEKLITITTPTSSVCCHIKLEAVYQPLLSFPTLPVTKQIDFGAIPLTSCLTVEERQSFDIVNTSNSILYLVVTNKCQQHVTIYEHDPSFPIVNYLTINPTQTLNINIRLRPELDIDSYRRYSTFTLIDSIKISVYYDPDDAYNGFVHQSEDISGSVFQTEIPVTALIGRVGLTINEKTVDFGCCKRNTILSHKLLLKNKASHIPLEVITTCGQSLSTTFNSFSLVGSKESKEPKEIEFNFKPTVEGVNTGKITFAINNVSLQYDVDVFAFIDPNSIEINLPRNELGYYVYDCGEIFLDQNKAISKRVSFTAKNISNMAIGGVIPELEKNFMLRPGQSTEISFDCPFSNNHNQQNNDQTFSQILQFCGRITKTVQQVVYVVGKYVTSVATVSPIVDLGIIVTSKLEKSFMNFQVINTTYGDLFLDLTKGCPYFDLPSSIGPVPKFKEVSIVAKANENAFQNDIESGHKNFTVQYVNRNNSANICNINVTMNVLKSFITADCGNTLEFNTFKEVVVEGNTIRTVSLFMTITNCLEEETSATVKVVECQQEEAKVEVLRRSSESRLESASMQGGEVIELRVKVTLAEGLSSLSSNGKTKVAEILFENEFYPGHSVEVFYNPTQSVQQQLQPQSQPQ